MGQTKSLDEKLAEIQSTKEPKNFNESRDSHKPKSKPEWADKTNDEHNNYEYSEKDVEDIEW